MVVAVLVEIWSDIACPWCYVGKRRFEEALRRFDGRDDVEVVWRSFELDPGAPDERPIDLVQHLADKYGMTRAEAAERQESLRATAAADGLDLRFDIARAGRTFDGHRLIHLGRAHGVQDAVKEALMRAYHSEGRLVADPETLRAAGAAAGIPADEVEATIGDDRFADAVRADEATARELGISAVPFFVVDRSLGASGAHPPDALLGMLERGREAGAGAAGIVD